MLCVLLKVERMTGVKITPLVDSPPQKLTRGITTMIPYGMEGLPMDFQGNEGESLEIDKRVTDESLRINTNFILY